MDKFAEGDRRYAAVTALQEKLQQLHSFEEVYPMSVTEGLGMNTLRADLVGR